MKTVRLLVFLILNLLVLNVGVCPLFAEAPTTPKILFTSVEVDNYDVYIMNPDGTESINLTQHPGDDLQAVWSPTGEEILFVSDRGDRHGGKRDLYLMDPDGSNVQRVFKKEFRGRTDRGDPTWSPDGKQFAYMYKNWDQDIYSIYTATLGEQEEEFLVNGFDPVWSPNGKEIAYHITALLTFVNVHAEKQERLLPRKTMYWQLQPSWSAAGDKLAFSGNKNQLPLDRKPRDPFPLGWVDKRTIYIVNRDGSGLQQLVDEAGPYAQYPALSPDGTEVLYTQSVNADFHIFKVDVNRGVRTQLTHHLSWNTGGDWFDPDYALSVAPQLHLLTTTWGEVKQR